MSFVLIYTHFVLQVSKKLPADTHIRDMTDSLTKLIVQELSLYKGSGE